MFRVKTQHPVSVKIGVASLGDGEKGDGELAGAGRQTAPGKARRTPRDVSQTA